MFINSTIGSTLNCGFCRTVVYECLTTKRDDKQKSDSRSKTSESKEGANKTVSFNVMCLCKKWMVRRLQMARHVYPSSLKALFCGSQFEVGYIYFDKNRSLRESKFERHCTKVQKPFSEFRSVNCKENYLATISSRKWKAMPASKKATHLQHK